VTNPVAQQEDQALAAAHSLIQEHKNQEAIVQLKALAASHPGTKGISHELGIAYYDQADYLEAATYLEEALRENPEDRDAAQLLGLSYYFSGKPTQAIPALEKVRLWHPNENIDAIYVLGLCYALNRNYPEALQTFSASKRSEPQGSSYSARSKGLERRWRQYSRWMPESNFFQRWNGLCWLAAEVIGEPSSCAAITIFGVLPQGFFKVRSRLQVVRLVVISNAQFVTDTFRSGWLAARAFNWTMASWFLCSWIRECAAASAWSPAERRGSSRVRA